MPAALTSKDPEPGPRAVLRLVDESDDYTSAVAGVTVEGARVGEGVGPNVVLGVPGDSVTVTSSHLGFPMTAGAHIPPDRIAAAFVHENTGGSRWCGVQLQPGSVIVYPPETAHLAVNHPGLHFTFAITEPERLMALAERLGLPTEIPRAPHLHEIPRSDAVKSFGGALDRLTRSAIADERFEQHVEPVLAAFARVLAGDPPAGPHRPGRGLDDRAIVVDCIDYAEAIGRIPTISELCAAAHVSERRLRSAFCGEFDRSPTRYFRTWALDRAHRWLRDTAPDECTVTQVACDLGFGHLGRFAGWYRAVYGEAPSATLRLT